MISNSILGLITLVVPLLVIGALILRKLPWIFALFAVALALGSGYLHQTGALKDIGREVRAKLPAGMLPEHKSKEAVTPASDTTPAAPAETPAAKPADAPAPAPAEPAPAPAATPPAPAPAPAPAAPAPANP